MKKIEVLDFTAKWCGPCRAMLPFIDSLMEEYNKEGSNVEIKKIDVDENSALPQEYEVRSIPTFVFLLDGVEIDRIRGAISKDDIVKRIQSAQSA